MFISPHIRIRISYASPHLFSASPLCKKIKPEGIWSLTPIRNLTTEFGPATCPDNQCWSLVEAPILRYIRIYGFPCILSIHPDISNFNRAHLQLSRPLQTNEVKMSWLSGIVYTPIHCRENQQYSVSARSLPTLHLKTLLSHVQWTVVLQFLSNSVLHCH